MSGGELDAAVKLSGRGCWRMGGGAGGKARTRGARKSREKRDAIADVPPSRSSRTTDFCYDTFCCRYNLIFFFFACYFFLHNEN